MGDKTSKRGGARPGAGRPRVSDAVKQARKFPGINLESRPVADLVPYAQNARTHSEAQLAKLAASIKEFGWTNPVLIGPDNGIVAGHGRVLAAQRLGMAEVPVIALASLTPAQRRAYVLADNRLAEDAGWDMDLLKIELGALRLEGFDLTLTGFNVSELSRILDGGGRVDPDEVPAVRPDVVSVPGDAWVLGDHRLVCGDATVGADVALAVNGAAPHLMVTDPPYGVNYDPAWRAAVGVNKNRDKMGKVANDGRADWREAWALFRGQVAYVWHAGIYAGQVAESLQVAGFVPRAQIIWAKDRFALSRGDYHWQHEPCWYAVRKGETGRWAGDRSQSTLWTIKAREDGGHGHGTQKPVECMRRPIENNSEPGDAVYEPFSGSGTTIIAAQMTGRRCHALELDPAYVDVAVRRFQAFAGVAATLSSDGRTFDEVALERVKVAA